MPPVSPRPTEKAARTLLRASRWVRTFKASDVRNIQWFANAIGAVLVIVVARLLGAPVTAILAYGAPFLALVLTIYLLLRHAVPEARLLQFLADRFSSTNPDKHVTTLLSASSSEPLDAYLRRDYPEWQIDGLANTIFVKKRVHRGRPKLTH